MDELRHADSKLFELETMAARDWQEGYMAKVEREERENALKHFRNSEANDTLAQQVAYKRAHEAAEREQLAEEKAHMRGLWAQADKEREDKEEDRQFVQSVLAKERALADKEEADRQRAIAQAHESNEALKMDMARKAESDAELIRMQNEEMERQWQKRYVQWEKEENARRSLMKEVYEDRAKQVEIKAAERQAAKDDRYAEAGRIKIDQERIDALEHDKEMTEALVRKRHQEELFRQMDFHQVQRHRELQQHAIEQRQAMIAEKKLQRALEAEKRKQKEMAVDIFARREQVQRERGLVAPWEK